MSSVSGLLSLLSLKRDSSKEKRFVTRVLLVTQGSQGTNMVTLFAFHFSCESAQRESAPLVWCPFSEYFSWVLVVTQGSHRTDMAFLFSSHFSYESAQRENTSLGCSVLHKRLVKRMWYPSFHLTFHIRVHNERIPLLGALRYTTVS